MSLKNSAPSVGICCALAVAAVGLFSVGSPVCAEAQIFKAPQAFPAGPNPVAEVSGDFNGDGKMDMAVANSNTGTVSVLLGNGDGTFQAPVTYTVGNGPVALVAGDFNSDGRLDLAVANGTDGTVSILLGNGDGTFQAAANYAVTAGACCMTIGDFNGDGKPDIAVNGGMNNSVQYLSVLLGKGDGTFQPALNSQTGFRIQTGNGGIDLSESSSLAVGDFNGDGKLDMVLSGFVVRIVCFREPPKNIVVCVTTARYSEVLLSLGNGDGTFAGFANLGINLSGPFAVGDFTGDGKLDLVAGGAVLLGNGDGTFQTVSSALYPYQIAAGDLNGDGKLDLAATNYPGVVSVLLGNGDGTFQTPVNYAAGPSQSGIAIADFNGDGKRDLAVANDVPNGAITILPGNGDGTFGPEAPEFQLGGSYPISAAAGDFNGDGKLDYVVTNLSGINSGSPGINVVLGNGDGTFQPEAFTAVTQGNPAGVAAADLNGDGKLDLAVATSNTGVLVFEGNGDGTFQPAVVYSTPDVGSFPAVAVGDLNGDNKPDLAVTDGSGHADILLGNGDGTFKAAVSYTSGQSCNPGSVYECREAPALGDFNGDGKPDLAVPDVAANTVNVLLGNGDGTFQPPVSYPVGTQPTAVAVADFNHDGKLDLAVGDNGGSTISILLGKGDGTFQAAVNYPVAAWGPEALLVGDFNGDGILDVATQGYGLASVLLGKGDGTFQPQLIYAFGDGEAGHAIAAGDFNGDYTTDLVVGGGLATLGDSTASVLFNIAGFYLYMSGSGTGGGMVTSNPAGINCGGTCTASFAGASTVTLTATPNSTSNFTGWKGACSGTGTCAVTMKAATSVTATFALQDFSLSPASTALSVPAAGQNTDVITLTGVSGPFNSAIQLTCTVTAGLSPLPTCGFSSASVTPGSNPATSTLTVTAPTATAAMQRPDASRLARSFYAAWLPLMFGIAVLGGSKKARRGPLVLGGFLLLMLFLQTACGNTSSNGSHTPPPTNYTVTVTATSGATQHTAQVSITVQ